MAAGGGRLNFTPLGSVGVTLIPICTDLHSDQSSTPVHPFIPSKSLSSTTNLPQPNTWPKCHSIGGAAFFKNSCWLRCTIPTYLSFVLVLHQGPVLLLSQYFQLAFCCSGALTKLFSFAAVSDNNSNNVHGQCY